MSGNIQHSGYSNVSDVEGGVWATITTRHLLGAPADNIRIEFAGGFGLAGHEFVPAEFSFCLRHPGILLFDRVPTHPGDCTASIDTNLSKWLSIDPVQT